MILHSPIFSGSINQAESAYANLSGSFTGSFKGVGDFEGLVADSIDYDNIFNVPTLVSGSSQISYPEISNIPSGIISSSAQIDTLFDIDGLVSGGAQVEFNTINNNPFSQSASSVTVSKNIVPTTNSITLGTAQNPFQDLYLSSASLYIDGQQVISSNATELIITTDENQSLKLIETGADTITLQTANGDITLTTTGTGNIELDAPIQIAAGNQIISSDGNAIQIGEDISVSGNIAVTGTVDGVDVAALKASFDTLNGKSVISGSSQVTISDTTGYSDFSSSLSGRISTEKGRIDAILLSADADKDSFAEIVSLINSVDTTNDNAFASFYTSSNNTNAAQDARLSSLETASGSAITRLDALEGTDITVSLSGDVSGSGTITNLGDVTISTTVQPNSVALGTDTTGNYMSNVSAGNAGISISHTQGEGSTATISLVSGVVSGSSQVNADSITNFDANVLAYNNSLGVISGSSQVNADSITNFDTNVLAYNNSLGVISGSSQVLGNTGIVSSSAQIDSLGFLKVDGDAVISGSSQVSMGGDLSGTADNAQIVAGAITNTEVNASAAIAYTKLNLQGSGIVSGSSQVFSDVSGDVVIASNGVATIQANSVALGTDTTGNYVAGVTAGNSIVVSGTAGEGWSPTITVGNGVVSGSSQIDALGFLKVDGDSVISGSSQVSLSGDITGTANNTAIASGVIVNDDVNASAAIAYTKLNLQGSGILSGSVQVQAGSITGDIALGTQTSGNYVATLGTGTGVTIGSNTGEGSTPTIAVNYGSTSNTAVQGNTTIAFGGTANEITIDAGSSITLGSGGTVTIGLADSIGGNRTFSGNVTVTGNLTVNGTTTSVNSNTVNIGDNIIVLNSDEAGAPSQDGGINIERGTSTNAGLIWSEANDYWMAGLVGSEERIVVGAGNTSITTLGTIATGTWQGTAIADGYISSAAAWNAKLDSAGTIATNDYAKYDASGDLVGRSYTEVKTDLSLNNVENTALSTWAGSGNITTLGTIASGTWNGSVIASAYLDADTAHLSTTQTFSGTKTFSAITTISNTTASTTKTTGALIVTGGVGVSGALNVGGDVVAYASSDKRLKDNIKNIENPIEKVQKLNGVTWDWNSNADELQQSLPNVGVIAQEVEEVFPQLVHNRDNGYKGVDYAKLTGLLIEAIKDQQKQIDELKSKLG